MTAMRQEMNWSRKKKATTLKIIHTDALGFVLNSVLNSVPNFATGLEPC